MLSSVPCFITMTSVQTTTAAACICVRCKACSIWVWYFAFQVHLVFFFCFFVFLFFFSFSCSWSFLIILLYIKELDYEGQSTLMNDSTHSDVAYTRLEEGLQPLLDEVRCSLFCFQALLRVELFYLAVFLQFWITFTRRMSKSRTWIAFLQGSREIKWSLRIQPFSARLLFWTNSSSVITSVQVWLSDTTDAWDILSCVLGVIQYLRFQLSQQFVFVVVAVAETEGNEKELVVVSIHWLIIN